MSVEVGLVLLCLETSGYVIDAAAKQGCGVWTLILWVVQLVVFGFVERAFNFFAAISRFFRFDDDIS